MRWKMEYKYGEPNKYGDFPYLYSGQWNNDNLRDILNERLPEYYNMELVDPTEAEVLAEIVNQGIDADLEAVTAKEQARLVNVRAGNHVVVCQKLKFVPDKEGMYCLIKRLIHYVDSCQDDIKGEAAYQLTSCIFETLQLEFSV